MERYSFFNSVNGDRKYKADDWALYFSKFITNGVFPNIASNLQVISDGTNMTVKLKAGAAWINGYMYENTADLNLNIDVADGVLNRIDRIVIQLSYADRLIKTVVKKGAFASSPVAPSLQRDADIYELGIADIAVNKGITTITQSMITDLRLNTSLCGMVNSLLQADTTAIFNQYQDWFNQKSVDYENEFESWFDTVKGQLSGDVAGNLQNQITTNTNSINNLAGTGRTTETVKGNADALAIHQADYVSHPGIGTTTNNGNAYSITLNPSPGSYIDKMGIVIEVNAASTGASTININGLGAKPIKSDDGTDFVELKANGIYTLRYNAETGNFILQGKGGGLTTVDKTNLINTVNNIMDA